MPDSKPRPILRGPAGLVVETFDAEGQEFAILEWPVAARAPRAGLPRAEREVLELLLAGLSNAEIARRRRRSPRTVAHQVDAVFRRLGVGSRLELYAFLAAPERPAAKEEP